MYILGISCLYHESAACLIKNGKVVAGSAEERFSRKKHDSGFPKKAIEFCLKKEKIKEKDLDFVVFYEKPFWKFHRIFISTLALYPQSYRLFAKAMAAWFFEKLWVRSIIKDNLKIDSKKILFVPHHLSHAASAFYPSGFEKSAILTMDGVGEWTTMTYGVGERNKIKIVKEMKFPHSLGLLYSTFTAFLGFEVNDGEYKVMGMAPYGKPKYLNKIKKIVKQYPDGSFALNMRYFEFHKSTNKSYSSEFVKLFGKPRSPDLHFFTKKSGYPIYFGEKPKDYNRLCDINQDYADIASSIQKFTEDLILKIANAVYKETLRLTQGKLENLCIAGGVGLNSVANGILLRHGPFKRIFVQPAAGDDGGAMGAALYVYSGILNKKRTYTQTTSYLGPEFSEKDIEKILKNKKIKYKKIISEIKLVDYLSDVLAKGKVIGFFHGRAEWGPRALGARSIMADPRREEMKEIVNTKVKFREPYRPFAPVVLKEMAHDYFELGNLSHEYLTNFMLGVFPVEKNMRKKIPAITHVGGSARPQIITEKQNSRYYNIIREFGRKTGVYVLMNTSFNLKGEPIVNTPQDALNTFGKSGLDILALENCIILKEDMI